MRYTIKPLKKENDLNKILKTQRNTQEDVHILFLSLWDEHCELLKERLTAKYGKSERGQSVYLVDSFNMPHSFVIFNSLKAPSLVSVVRGKVTKEDYLPRIYKKFSL